MSQSADEGAADAGAGSPWRPALALALPLLALAGFVDAVGFLGFGLYPSFMSGDVTQLGVARALDWTPRALLLLCVLAVFAAGAFLGQLLHLRTGRRTPTLAVEAALLGLAALSARAGLGSGALACAAAAMGAQTTVRLRLGGLPLGVAFVTGALSRAGAGLAGALAGGSRTAWAAHLLLVIALGAGAALGGLCYGRLGLESLWPAAASAVLVTAAAGWAERRSVPRDPA